MKNGLEIVKGKRMPQTTETIEAEVITPSQRSADSSLSNVVADNFPQILNLAADIVEISKMQVQSNAVLRQMEESRKTLLAEAEAYAKKKNADTDSVVKRMEIVREMMRDFYQSNGQQCLSGEEFSRIISSIVNEMGKL